MRSDSRFSETTTILQRKVETDPAEAALAGRSGYMDALDYRDVPVASAFAPFTFAGVTWEVLAEQDLAEMLAPAVSLRNKAVSLLVIVSGALALIGIFAARSVSRPITALAKVADRLSRHDLEVPHRDRQDEVGLLAATVEHFKETLLADEVRQVESEKEQRQRTASAERLRRLAADFDTQVREELAVVGGFTRDLPEDRGAALENRRGNQRPGGHRLVRHRGHRRNRRDDHQHCRADQSFGAQCNHRGGARRRGR